MVVLSLSAKYRIRERRCSVSPFFVSFPIPEKELRNTLYFLHFLHCKGSNFFRIVQTFLQVFYMKNTNFFAFVKC